MLELSFACQAPQPSSVPASETRLGLLQKPRVWLQTPKLLKRDAGSTHGVVQGGDARRAGARALEARTLSAQPAQPLLPLPLLSLQLEASPGQRREAKRPSS